MPSHDVAVRAHLFPLPVPPGPWQWQQHWSDLLFMHWQVNSQSLRPHVPARLELDTWDAHPWVSLVAFRLRRVCHHWLPSFGMVDNIIELNLRTYVRYKDEPAIYFLSIHADKRLPVAMARLLTPLPYALARMAYDRNGGGSRFQCSRLAAPDVQHCLDVSFTSPADSHRAPTGSPDEWLLERYGLYAAGSNGNLLRTIVQHAPWQVHDVSPRCSVNMIGSPFKLDLSREPDLSHHASGMKAHVWPFACPDCDPLSSSSK